MKVTMNNDIHAQTFEKLRTLPTWQRNNSSQTFAKEKQIYSEGASK